MSSMVRTFGVLAVCLVISTAGWAQTIDLAAGAADPIWRGTRAGASAGGWLDQGAVSHGDTRRDLVVGEPGGPGIAGTVYVIFGGPTRTGDLSLSASETVIHGGAPGDLFGTATATGNILNLEGATPKTLVVGAPGALSGRGSVYVFTSGFRSGDSLSTGDAVAQIVGNAGDQIGVSLATADLNNDGYREIVIGAPGTGRIYVVAGGPTLAGVIDLSVTSAAVTITSPGLGLNLAAGDITGDGIYDLLVGHPAANAVHVLKGRNGTMPPAVLDMTFGGVEAGDGVGASIRLADVDADGRSDIVVGAPDADGPSNTRSNAGEVYLIWGGPSVSGRSLLYADVTFFGRDAGERMGALLGGGDINRDTPNDLVLVSAGARGGAGALHLYYGRGRNSIGVPRGDGPRVVDFGNEIPDRSILGDTAGGSVTSTLVFEVTGEGARDVVVGMSENTGGVGAVYFTISPRLTLGSSSVSLSGYQGLVSSSPVPVRNISEIPITWQTTSNRAWLSATLNGSTSASAFGDLVITANGNGLPPGTHTGTVTVTSTSRHLTMSQAIAVTFEVKETQPSPAGAPVGGAAPGAVYNLLWRHSTEGWLAFWHMNGITMTGAASLSINQMADPNWRVAATGDMNGDGFRDIVWQHETDGWLAVWYLQGNQVTFTGYLSVNRMVDPTWKIRGSGDTDGDGKADLLWQNTADGRLAVWYMDGTQVRATIPLSINKMSTPNWFIRAVGDTDGDGRADIIWHKSDTGELAVWYLNGWAVTGTHRLSIGAMTDTNWTIAGAEDVNGDRKADILWQHASGTLATWYLDGRTVTGTLKLNPSSAAGAAWRIAGPR
jgi:hypothetical protein